MEKIREIWRNEAKRLLDNDSSALVPSMFRPLSLKDLRKTGLLPDLIKTYQEVFGDPDIWNEGAFCSAESWANTISLVEYNKRRKEARLRCECGGIFQPCYPAEILEARIVDELADSERSILVLMGGSGEFKITGFLWGIVAEFEEIQQRILNARYGGKRDAGLIELHKLNSQLQKRGLLDTKFLYGDEMGVLRQFRGSIAFLYLIRLWIEHGHQRNAKKALFWTSKRSPLYKIAPAFGCDMIHTTREGIEFFLHPDFEPVLKVMQSSSEKQIRDVLQRTRWVLRSE